MEGHIAVLLLSPNSLNRKPMPSWCVHRARGSAWQLPDYALVKVTFPLEVAEKSPVGSADELFRRLSLCI
jgi:hypothetical protein